MRRNNERLLQEHIDAALEEHKDLIKKCDIIYLHAPGMNRIILMSESRPLKEVAQKVRGIEF